MKREKLPKSSKGVGRNNIDVRTKTIVKVTDQVVLHDAVILDLKSKMDVMEKFMMAMAKEQKTG